LTHLDLAWQGNQWGSRRARVVELEGTSQATRAEAESLTAALAGREAALTEAKLARAEAAERIERAQHALYEIRASREAAESEVRTSELRAEDILARSGEIRREVAECDVALSEIETRLSGGAQERSAREGEVTQFDASFRERSTEVEQSIRAVAAAEVGLRKLNVYLKGGNVLGLQILKMIYIKYKSDDRKFKQVFEKFLTLLFFPFTQFCLISIKSNSVNFLFEFILPKTS
jgi:chromosome segregation ATPase